MKTSDKGVMSLIIHEGVVPGPYLDSVGVVTYGIGHTHFAGSPDPRDLPRGMPQDLDKTLKEIFQVFRKDLAKYEAEVLQALKVKVEQHEFDALVSFHYNTGGIAKAALTRHLNSGDRKAAAEAFMGWSRPKEIIPRRKAEQALFARGEYTKGRATVWGVTDSMRVVWKPVRTLSSEEILRLMQPRRVTNSRTLQGASLAGFSQIGALATEAAEDVFPLLPYADSLKWVFVALTLVGVGFAMYARLDDWNKGRK